MNVYDFDGTIYDGDSTVDFYFYCIQRKPILILHLPQQLFHFLGYALKLEKKEKFKETVYYMMTQMPEMEKWIVRFWDKNMSKIKSFYLNQKKSDDLVISASPEFLVQVACDRLQIRALASRVNAKTGKHDDGINCHGKRKVERFRELFPHDQIHQFYSDSYSDNPLATLAKEAFFVKGTKILPWRSN